MGKAVEVLIEIRELLKANARPLLGAKEVGDFLGCHEKTVQKWERLGRIPPPVQSPGGPMWRRDELLAWVKKLPARRKKARRFKPVNPDEPRPDARR